MSSVPRWRIAAGIGILVALAGFGALFAPIYVHNLELQNYVAGITHVVGNQAKSDDVLRTWVLDKARRLDLPITEDNVHITRTGGNLEIDVRYFVTVNLPGYTVTLHFYPGAGSR